MEEEEEAGRAKETATTEERGRRKRRRPPRLSGSYVFLFLVLFSRSARKREGEEEKERKRKKGGKALRGNPEPRTTHIFSNLDAEFEKKKKNLFPPGPHPQLVSRRLRHRAQHPQLQHRPAEDLHGLQGLPLAPGSGPPDPERRRRRARQVLRLAQRPAAGFAGEKPEERRRQERRQELASRRHRLLALLAFLGIAARKKVRVRAEPRQGRRIYFTRGEGR